MRDQAAWIERQLGARHAADQSLGQLFRAQVAEPRRQLGREFVADDLGTHAPLQQPAPRGRLFEHVGQQVVQLQHLDALVLQRADEGVVVGARLGDPQHVVEQQLAAVGRRQALLRQAGPADQHALQAADFAGDAVTA